MKKYLKLLLPFFIVFSISFSNNLKDNFKNLEQEYLKEINNNKKDVAPVVKLAILYHNENMLLEAEKYYLLAIEMDNDVKAMNNLALLYKEQGKLDLAKKYYDLSKTHSKK